MVALLDSYIKPSLYKYVPLCFIQLICSQTLTRYFYFHFVTRNGWSCSWKWFVLKFWKTIEKYVKNPCGHKSTFKFYQIESFKKLNIDNSKGNYIEFVGPLMILTEAPVTSLVWTWGTNKIFLSKGILEEV